MAETSASIDIGSHTARLLVAGKGQPDSPLQPFARKRTYIRLAESFSRSGGKVIQPEALDRTRKALLEFASCARSFGAGSIHAVATGVVREAVNGEEFLNRLQEQTGIRIRVISGEEEALLSGRGALCALGLREEESAVFDLGGGSTEFLFWGKKAPVLRSLPLGALALKEQYLKSDPPERHQIEALSALADRVLEEARLREQGAADHSVLVGTGGTVTTLAAILEEVPVEEVSPERLNGTILEFRQIRTLFNRIKILTLDERLGMKGLDSGRADVITAGTLIVMRIMEYLCTDRLRVSLSDLLDAILMEYFKGENHE